MSDTFHKGDMLIIVPADQDDPEALKHQGETCKFVRYSPTGYAVVESGEGEATTFHTRRPFFFRPQDLQLKTSGDGARAVRFENG